MTSSSLRLLLNIRYLSHLLGLVASLISNQCTLVDTLNLLAVCGLRPILTLQRDGIVLHIVERPSLCFTTLSSKSGPLFGVPTVGEFREMWKAWDLVTLGMIPYHLLHIKPIDLRHKCLFYLGHIPTWVHLPSRESHTWRLCSLIGRFYNILLSKILQKPYVESQKFTTIFEVCLLHNPQQPSASCGSTARD